MVSHDIVGPMVGSVMPLGSRQAPSGIDKHPVDRPLHLGTSGFEGDAQGDTKRHGGPEKAVHHYPFDHYAAWRMHLGERPVLTRPGAFGENLSTIGLLETAVAIGDVFTLGAAIIEVSQGRQPCWKLNERFGSGTMARDVQTSGRTGWYYRVVKTGLVTPDDRLVLIDRRAPEWTIGRIWRIFYVDTMNVKELEAIATLSPLAAGWREHAARRLVTRQVEDWRPRLEG